MLKVGFVPKDVAGFRSIILPGGHIQASDRYGQRPVARSIMI